MGAAERERAGAGIEYLAVEIAYRIVSSMLGGDGTRLFTDVQSFAELRVNRQRAPTPKCNAPGWR